jgi:hypothetical protein
MQIQILCVKFRLMPLDVYTYVTALLQRSPEPKQRAVGRNYVKVCLVTDAPCRERCYVFGCGLL